VRRFGRRFSGDGRDVDPWEPSPSAGAGRRLAVIGLLVAVAIPLAFPSGMSSGMADRFGPGLGPGGSGEGGGVGRVNLFAELYGQLNLDETVDLVQVTTDDPSPFYLRLATADRITDTGFEPSAPSGQRLHQYLPTAPEPAPRAGVSYHEHRAEVEVKADFHMQMAPTYAQLVDVDGLSDEWLYDPAQQIVYSDRHGARGQDYRITYQRAEYDPDALRQAERLPLVDDIQAQFTQVPELPEVRELLDDLIDDSATPYDQVLAIHAFFSRTNGFRYDLETGPETDAPAIVDFLENRVGFCVQYATAMAWLVRSIDMPARVAFGFTRGSGSGDSRVLTNRNLHAWTEVYFDGFGWVPFDPTPSGPVVGSTSPQWAPNPDAPSGPDATDPGDGPTADNADDPGFDPADEGPHIDENGPVGGAAPPTGPTVPWWGLGAVLLMLALLATPATHRNVQRRRRLPRDAGGQAIAAPGVVVSADATAAARHRAHQAWREVLDTMIDLSIPVDPSETPRATARRLATYAAESPDAARALHLLGHLEERARYARAPLPPEGIRAAVSTLRRALAGQATSRVRIRATLLPPSTLLRWRNAVGEAMVQASRATTRMGEQLARMSPRRLLRSAR
jgi:transglutaminase-like putative cysteine protease